MNKTQILRNKREKLSAKKGRGTNKEGSSQELDVVTIFSTIRNEKGDLDPIPFVLGPLKSYKRDTTREPKA